MHSSQISVGGVELRTPITRTQNRVNRDLRSFQHENDFRINIKMVLALVGSSSLAEGGRSNIKDVTNA